MSRNAKQEGFGVFFDPTKSTSGQLFFGALYRELSRESIPLDRRPAAILFNVSAPIGAVLKAKFLGQKIVVRIDGLYFDRLSPAFLARFNWPFRKLFSLGLRYSRTHNFFAFWANLINQNYAAFARVVLADFIVYQSRFSQVVHAKYFPNKSYAIIVNGAILQAKKKADRDVSNEGEIQLTTIYDDWKPAKRIQELVDFVLWANEQKGAKLKLTILGYTGKIPACSPLEMKEIIETSPYIRTLPEYRSFSGEFRDALLSGDVYITFTYRDPCPNTVVEAMAHGLPIVGVASGGMADIVGDAGILLPSDDFADGFFSCHRYENDFPPVDFEKVLDAVFTVMSNRETFESRVHERFTTDLGISVVADRYAAVIRALLANAATIKTEQGQKQ